MARRSTTGEPPATDVDALVRQRLRSLRTSRGLSLEELARRSGLHPSTVSRLETGGRRLALDQLAPLAKALDTTIDELVDTSVDDGDVVIRPRRDEVSGHVLWHLSRDTGPNGTVVVKMRLTPRSARPEQRVHPGRDWFYVLSGTVQLFLGDREILVHAGQAADFPTMTPHSFTAHLRPAELISIFDQTGRQAHA